MQLQDMIDRLKTVSDEAWGHYILKRDILYRKMKKDEMPILIENSIECGVSHAKNVKDKNDYSSIERLAIDMGLIVTDLENKPGTNRITFAKFTTPNHIQIMSTPLKRIGIEVKKLNPEEQEIFKTRHIRELLIAHEMFHFIEEVYKKDIYTRNHRITLWKIFGFENKSTLRSLSEIAGMYFAKEMTNFPYSPLMLDVILFYPFDKNTSEVLFNQIIELDDLVRRGEL